jgi:gamma-glutamyltranspeptidase/glutathione hydrolase
MSGVIAAGHPQTAEAGAEVLGQGGNAVDAAAAATFASFVTESALVNIGGGGIAQVYDPVERQAVVYDFFSTMPGQGRLIPPEQLDFRRVLVDFGAAQQPFYIGRGSVAVPGVVAGLCAMVKEKGKLSLPQVLAPTIRLAREGILLSDIHAYITGLLTPILTDTPGVAAIYAPTGRMATTGERLYFPELANTLEQLGQHGADLFYWGSVAQKIVADQETHGGLLTATDLATYQVLHTKPIPVDYRSFTVLLPPPSSAGGTLIAFALNLLETVPLSGLAHNGADHLQIMAEVMRLTGVARAEWEEEADESLTTTGLRSVHRLLSAGNIQKYSLILRERLAGQLDLDEPTQAKGPSNTTHLSVADETGMIAAITTSAGESAGFVVDGTGIMLNNMLGEADLHPQGFHRLPAGVRFMTMMCPILILNQGQPWMALGSGGSNRIRSALLQVISNVVDFKLDPVQAVEAPRLHFEDNVMQLEGGIDPNVAAQLEARGYRANRWPARNMFFGGVHMVARQEETEAASTRWMAVGDTRRGGSVARV